MNNVQNYCYICSLAELSHATFNSELCWQNAVAQCQHNRSMCDTVCTIPTKLGLCDIICRCSLYDCYQRLRLLVMMYYKFQACRSRLQEQSMVMKVTTIKQHQPAQQLLRHPRQIQTPQTGACEPWSPPQATHNSQCSDNTCVRPTGTPSRTAA